MAVDDDLVAFSGTTGKMVDIEGTNLASINIGMTRTMKKPEWYSDTARVPRRGFARRITARIDVRVRRLDREPHPQTLRPRGGDRGSVSHGSSCIRGTIDAIRPDRPDDAVHLPGELDGVYLAVGGPREGAGQCA